MTGNQLYEQALDLLSLRNTNKYTNDTADLKARALSLINIILAENSALDCRVRKCEHTVKIISSLDSEIDFSDIVASSVLPYSLAFLLILGEDDALASAMSRLSEEAKQKALRFGKPEASPITEVY